MYKQKQKDILFSLAANIFKHAFHPQLDWIKNLFSYIVVNPEVIWTSKPSHWILLKTTLVLKLVQLSKYHFLTLQFKKRQSLELS